MPESKTRIGQFVTTVPVTAVNVSLIEPRAFQDDKGRAKGDPKYGVTLMFDGDSPDLKVAKQTAAAVAKAAFPGLPLEKITFPFRSGDKLNEKRKAKGKSAFEHQAGKVVFAARSANQPALSGEVNGVPMDFTNADSIKANSRVFYNGVKVLVQINFAAYGEAADADDNSPEARRPGVTAYLNQLYSTGKGDRLGGAGPASEVFKGYLGQAKAVDPTDDEIPF